MYRLTTNIIFSFEEMKQSKSMSRYHRTPVAQELSGTASLCFHRTKAHPRHEELTCLIVLISNAKKKIASVYCLHRGNLDHNNSS